MVTLVSWLTVMSSITVDFQHSGTLTLKISYIFKAIVILPKLNIFLKTYWCVLGRIRPINVSLCWHDVMIDLSQVFVCCHSWCVCFSVCGSHCLYVRYSMFAGLLSVFVQVFVVLSCSVPVCIWVALRLLCQNGQSVFAVCKCLSWI